MNNSLQIAMNKHTAKKAYETARMMIKTARAARQDGADRSAEWVRGAMQARAMAHAAQRANRKMTQEPQA